jgi:hypothetical protein
MACQDSIHAACEIKRRCLNTDQLLKQVIENKNTILQENPLQIHEHPTVVQENEASPCSSERSKKKRETGKKSRPVRADVTRNKNKRPEEDDYRCFICQKTFDLISAKDSHVKQEHKDVKVSSLKNHEN